jgi:hypothetical protein
MRTPYRRRQSSDGPHLELTLCLAGGGAMIARGGP